MTNGGDKTHQESTKTVESTTDRERKENSPKK